MEFTKSMLLKMISLAKERIEANLDHLNALDTATGDGDHGTAILSAIKGADTASAKDAPLSQMLQSVGWGVMNATGGSTSSLLGSFFLGLSDAIDKENANPATFVKMLASGLEQVQVMTTAKVGDKTLMDALIPAVEAAQSTLAAHPKATIAEILAAVADAAEKGAASTEGLVAKFGRAKNLGERSVGHVDAGATSIAILMRAFADAVK